MDKHCFSAELSGQSTLFTTPGSFIKYLLERGTTPASKLIPLRPLSCAHQDWELNNDTGNELLRNSSIGRFDNIKLCLKQEDVDVNHAQESTGVTALMCACVGGYSDVVKVLLRKGADPTATDKAGFNSLHCALLGKELKNVKAILSKSSSLCAAVDQWDRHVLHISAATGDLVVFKWLMKKFKEAHGARDNAGRTVLHWAVLSGEISVVELVLSQKHQKGIIGVADNEGSSPLHYAMLTGSLDITNCLLNKSAELTQDNQGLTPLHWAGALGEHLLVDCILSNAERNSLISATSISGQTALHSAACVGSERVCKALVEADSEVNFVDKQGSAPLHLACRFGHTACVRTLLSNGAQINSLAHSNRTALSIASEHGHHGVVGELILQGADRDQATGEHGNSAIHIAALAGHSKVIEAILSGGCCVDLARASDQRTALHLAAGEGHVDCCKLLLEKGAALNARDSMLEGFTPLDMSLEGGHNDCARCLIVEGAVTKGGRHHRAALTIQLCWKYHVHKRRRRIAYQCAALLIQHVARKWLCRRRAARLRIVREKRRHTAAHTIQTAWITYMTNKKRFEESCAALRAKLAKERSATQLILTELQEQTFSIQLPTASPSRIPPSHQLPPLPPIGSTTLIHPPPPPPHLLPSRLLRTSLQTSSIFPTSGLVFIQKPKQPLYKRCHTIKLASNSSFSVNVDDSVESTKETPQCKTDKLPHLSSARTTVPQPSASAAPTRETRTERLPPLLQQGEPHAQREMHLLSTDKADQHLPKSHLSLSESRKKTTRKKKPMVKSNKGNGSTALDKEVDHHILLHHVERYKKLQELMGFLQEAKQATKEGREGIHSTDELRQEIKLALEEAVRLRAETESLHSSNKVYAQ